MNAPVSPRTIVRRFALPWLCLVLLQGAQAQSWPSFRYVTPAKMVIGGGISPSANYAYTLYVVGPDGVRTNVFAGTWGQAYGGPHIISNPATGRYGFWMKWQQGDLTDPDNIKILAEGEYEASSYNYGGGIAGEIDEAVTVSSPPDKFPAAGSFTATVVAGGSLKLLNLEFPAQPAKAPVFQLTSAGGPVTVEDCKNIALAVEGSDVFVKRCQLRFVRLKNGNLEIDGSVIDSDGLDYSPYFPYGYKNLFEGETIAVTNCAFGYNSKFIASKRLEVSGSDFYGYHQLRTSAGGTASIAGNTFRSGEVWMEVSGTSVFQGNSHYGRYANFFGDVSIEDNYWGGANGPKSLATAEAPGWLHRYGAAFDVGKRPVKTFRSSGVEKRTALNPRRVTPKIWLEGRRIGQNALTADGSLTRMGRPVWFSYDLRTDEPSLELAGVTLTLKIRSTSATGAVSERILKPANPLPARLRRDYWGYWDRTRWVVSFMMPPSNDPKIEAQLLADFSGMKGFTDPWETYRNPILDWATFYQRQHFARPLRIGITSVVIPGEARVSPAKHRQQIDRLRQDLVVIWPLAENEIELVDLGDTEYDGGMLGLWLPKLTLSGLANNISTSLSWYMLYYNKDAPSRALDAMVAVLPGAVLGNDNHGANLAGRRRVMLVHEDKPGAALHELGHGLAGLWIPGLLLGKEQYEQKSGFRDGYRFVEDWGALIRDTVIFNPSSTNTQALRAGGIMQFPQEEHLADYEFYDFMGAREPFWILPRHLSDVHTALGGLLGYSPTPYKPKTAPAPVIPALRALAAPAAGGGPGRILFTGMLEWNATASAYKLADGSLRAQRVDPASSATIPPSGPIGTALKAFTATGQLVGGAPLNLCWNNNNQGDYVPWAQTMDFESGQNPVKYQVLGKTYRMRTSLKNTLAASIVKGGADRPDAVRLTWTASGRVPGETPMPLAHSMHYSSDGGVSWNPVWMAGADNRIDVPVTALKSGVKLKFRLSTSDGFSMVTAVREVGPLAPFRTESVAIREPVAGDQGPTGTKWRLTADVTGTPSKIEWTSSLGGVLGGASRLENVTLANGRHVLTCKATFAGGLIRAASVEVVVGGAPDLRLRPGDLTVLPAGADPVSGATGWQSKGKNYIRLKVRNTGTSGYWTMRMFITPPGAAEKLLASKTVLLEAFQELPWLVACQSTTASAHRIRADVMPATNDPAIPAGTPPTTDANLTNNTLVHAPSNETPNALPQWLAVAKGGSVTFLLESTDGNGDALSWRVTRKPAHGTVSGTAPRLTYKPAAGFTGDDLLEFTAGDGKTTSGVSQVVFKVGGGVPAAPGELPFLTLPKATVVKAGRPLTIPIGGHPRADSVKVVALPPGLALSKDFKTIIGTPKQTGTQIIRLAGVNRFGTGPVVASTLRVLAAAAGQPLTAKAATLPDKSFTTLPNGLRPSGSTARFLDGAGLRSAAGIGGAAGWQTRVRISSSSQRQRFLTLTAIHPHGGLADAPTVEVSPNLVDWFSGPQHTTVLEKAPGLLKVRDNTPMLPGQKRHIRIKPGK